MTQCFFVSDLHGSPDRYRKLFRAIAEESPAGVFLGGDLLPSGLFGASHEETVSGDFVEGFLASEFRGLRRRMGATYPRVFAILGNDDSGAEEPLFLELSSEGLWSYAHDRCLQFDRFTVRGYSFVPPTPFLMKDWERYDVSRFVDPGCTSPEEGLRSVPVDASTLRYSTIEQDLAALAGGDSMENAIFLFHTPPYDTKLDRAALDGKMVDHAPLDVHVGSIAVRRFIETNQPLVTLHGHVHESAQLTGTWQDRIERTHLFTAAHDGPELSLVRFDLDDLDATTRELL
jgi:uncharacterized protein